MKINQAQQKKHEISNPTTLYDPICYGYSHMATVPANSTMIYVAGQGDGQHKHDTISNFRSQVAAGVRKSKAGLVISGLHDGGYRQAHYPHCLSQCRQTPRIDLKSRKSIGRISNFRPKA